MYQIDFLPEEYRHRRAAHRQQLYRLVGLGVVAALAGIACAALYCQQRDLEEQLEIVQPTYCTLAAQQRQLHILQSHLESVRSMAELVCYLQHPWPRTQILSQLLGPLPETVTLEQLSIDRQPPEQGSPQRPLSRSEQEAEKARLAAMPPASRDLHHLRQECDPMQTIVRVTGFTEDVVALHQYLAALEKADLFTKVHLLSLEKTGEQEPLRFQLKLVVRPGYGQAGGPIGSVKSAAGGGPPASPNPPNSRQPSPDAQSKSFRRAPAHRDIVSRLVCLKVPWKVSVLQSEPTDQKI